MTRLQDWGIPIELGERRFLHPGPLRWLRTLGWLVGLFMLIGLANLPVYMLVETVLPKDNPPLDFLMHCVNAAVVLGLYWLMVWLAEGRRPSEVALKPAPAGILTGLVIGVLMFAAVMAVMAAFGLYDITWTGLAPAWKPAGLAVESGMVEEIIARAVILRLLWRALGPWVAFIGSAALFGAGHLANPNATTFAVVCIALEAGIMLGAFYALTGRLWVSIGVHASWNFTQGYLFGAAVSGTDFGEAIARSTARPGFPEWLTGGPFGPEASLPALLICTGVGVAVLVLAWKAGRFARAVPASTA